MASSSFSSSTNNVWGATTTTFVSNSASKVFPDITDLEMALESEANPMFFYDLKMEHMPPPPLLSLDDLDVLSSAPTSPCSYSFADESSPQTSCVSSPTSSRFQSRVNSPEPDLAAADLAELHSFLEFGVDGLTAAANAKLARHASSLALLQEQEDDDSCNSDSNEQQQQQQPQQEIFQLIQQQQQLQAKQQQLQANAMVAKRTKQRKGRLSRDGSSHQPKRFAKRDSHNQSERQRRLDLKHNFAELQANIPSISDGRRVHTATILKEAIDLIFKLQREDAQLQAALQAARSSSSSSSSSFSSSSPASPVTQESSHTTITA